MNKSDFYIEIPTDQIAQFPADTRSGSRLMCLDGSNGNITHGQFAGLPDLLRPGDRLVFNDTRVVPARLIARKPTGGRVEMLLERILSVDTALVKYRASKPASVGQRLCINLSADSVDEIPVVELEIIQRQTDFVTVQMPGGNSIIDLFHTSGQMPLPPYIDRNVIDDDTKRYQTVYARHDGAVAAPTAGLHFSEDLLNSLAARGIDSSFVTLHVGAGTFQPLRVEDIDQHVMHSERYSLSDATADELEKTRASGGRVIAVGTTCVRTLESAASLTTCNDRLVMPSSGMRETDLFIRPGYAFRVVDGMITNFHLPESTLLMLVCAFAGHSETLAAYREAVQQKYRFYSYGDAMLIWPRSS